MVSYMSDEEPLALPPMLPSTSQLPGASINVLEMISQDVMLGMQPSNASTEVTYVAQNAAPSIAPLTSSDAFSSLASTTGSNTIVTPFSDSLAKNAKTNPKPTNVSKTKPSTTQSQFAVGSNLNEKQLVRNPFASTRSEHANKEHKSSSKSSKKFKCKTHSSHNCSKSTTKNRSKSLNTSISSPKVIPNTTCSVKSVTHTVTRTTSIITQCIAFTTETITHTATTLAQITNLCTAAKTVSSIEATLSHQNLEYTTSMLTSYTITRSRAPMNIISPMQSTFLPNLLYSRPIISRTPTASPTSGRIEQFAILPAQAAYAISTTEPSISEVETTPRPLNRLVIPVTINSLSSSIDTTTASAVDKNVNPVQDAPMTDAVTRTDSTNTKCSSVASRPLTHGSFALPPGAHLYAARKITKPGCLAKATTEPSHIAIVDGKGTYTTLTFSDSSGGSLLTSQNTCAGSSIVSNATPTDVRPRNQLFIPLANSQMNASTSLGYLVTSPIGSDATSCYAVASTTTDNTAKTIASHTITTISSEALNRIRSRLIYNVPNTASGITPATISDANRPRGPVTIITNQLISSPNAPVTVASRAIFSAASQSMYAITAPVTTVSSTTTESTTRRVVIPINVHATSNNPVSTQNTYIIAGVGASTTGDAVTRPSRVVIPVIHNTSTVTSTFTTTSSRPCTTTGGNSPHASTEAYSKLRNRLTIHVGTTESPMPGTTTPITAYTIARSRAPQSTYAIPSGSAPYISKTSEGARSPATMTLITFAPPPSTISNSHRSSSATRETPSPIATCAGSTVIGTGNRFVIKLASGPNGGSTSSVTTSITSAVLGPTEHQFTEPHPVSTRLRTFPAPRTYSIAQRNAASPHKSAARNLNPRVKKVSNPAPLQIFTEVVCPPTTTHTITTAASSNKSRFTLSQTPGSSTLIVPQYKNTVFKNLSTVAHPERGNSRLLGPRTERFVLNRSVAFVSPRRSSPVQSDARGEHSTPVTYASSSETTTSPSRPYASNQDDQME